MSSIDFTKAYQPFIDAHQDKMGSRILNRDGIKEKLKKKSVEEGSISLFGGDGFQCKKSVHSFISENIEEVYLFVSDGGKQNSGLFFADTWFCGTALKEPRKIPLEKSCDILIGQICDGAKVFKDGWKISDESQFSGLPYSGIQKNKVGGYWIVPKSHSNYQKYLISALFLADSVLPDGYKPSNRELSNICERAIESPLTRLTAAIGYKQDGKNVNFEDYKLIYDLLWEFNINFETQIEDERIKSLTNDRQLILQKFDVNGDNCVDIVDSGGLNELIRSNQSDIIAIDRDYIQKFVKISNYIKAKRNNIELIFDGIKNVKNEKGLVYLSNGLQLQIDSYNSLLFHSSVMVGALLDSDMITFYEIYELFDSLKIFESNWEKEVSERLAGIDNRLANVESSLTTLIQSVEKMERNITEKLAELTYVTSSSFEKLTTSINKRLDTIGGKINLSNILSTAQLMETRKLTKHFKS